MVFVLYKVDDLRNQIQVDSLPMNAFTLPLLSISSL